MAQNTIITNQNIKQSNISTYGALILPFDVEEVLKKTEVEVEPEEKTTFKGQLKTALGLSSDPTLKDMLKNPGQTFDTLAEYTKDARMKVSGVMNDVMSKFSGIAIAQAIMDGKISSREALDYLFMGFAPALGVQGSLMGYSGLNQMKDALSNGTINVGAFISGFTRTLQGITDLKDMLLKKETQTAAEVLEFDLTISHNEQYQSETPDRRVQSGQSLNEYVHNMPITIDVECALQEGKRYSKAEFRAILQYLRNKKETVQLILGDEIFDSLILTNFNPTHDCTKSGMDYALSFKTITRCDIDTNTEVSIQPAPKMLESDSAKITSVGSLGNVKSLKNVKMPSVKTTNFKDEFTKAQKEINSMIEASAATQNTRSALNQMLGEHGNYDTSDLFNKNKKIVRKKR